MQSNESRADYNSAILSLSIDVSKEVVLVRGHSGGYHLYDVGNGVYLSVSGRGDSFPNSVQVLKSSWNITSFH